MFAIAGSSLVSQVTDVYIRLDLHLCGKGFVSWQ